MTIKDNYIWEAETKDGQIITSRSINNDGDLSDCKRISFIPNNPLLFRQDIVDVPLKRRFGRSIEKVSFNSFSMLPGFLFWEDDSDIIKTEEDLSQILKPFSMIKKRHDGEIWWVVKKVEQDKIILFKKYIGKTKRIESKVYISPPSSEYLHCVVGHGWRFYLKSSNGSVLLTAEDFELYL